MNAPGHPLTRSEEQALFAPFLIEDEEVVRMIARLADERGTAMAEVIKLAVEAYWSSHELSTSGPEWLERFWRDHQLPLPTGLKADKRFYDSLNDEL